MAVRVRIKLDVLHDLIARGGLSQNHWAIKIGISRGHWSEIVNGKHLYPSPRTRERMVEVFGIPFDQLFDVEAQREESDPNFQAAVRERYLIDDEIGQGGMGVVYLARDVKLGRSVAIKVLSPEAVTGIGVEQFLREIRYTARLQHQNILAIHDAGEAAGHPFYVMPYVKGGSLRQRLAREGPLDLPETLRIARGVAKALGHAHDGHLLHCDVKPENVLLGDDHVYVADFGIARAIHAEVLEWGSRVGVDSSAGTPAYVSPEQASGELNLDARADVYSFACMVFEMLAGRAPFTGRNSMEIVAQRFTSAVPDVREYAPHVPVGVAMAIRRAMELPPIRRYSTTTSFFAALEHGSRKTGPVRRAVSHIAHWTAIGWRRVIGPRESRRRLLRGIAMEGLLHDLRQAGRSLRRAPLFAVIAVVTLALGIGATTAIFTVVNGVLVRPLPYDRPDELAMVWELDRRGEGGDGSGGVEWTVAPATYLAWRDRARAIAEFAAFNVWSATLSGDGAPERVLGGVVSPNLFALLGVPPMLGTGFAEEHAVPGNDRVVVLGHGLWQRRFGGSESVLGRAITLNGETFTVLGVMPPGYRHPEPNRNESPEIWSPLALTDPDTNYGRFLRVVGRMRPGLTAADVGADLDVISRQLEGEWPASHQGWRAVVRPVHDEIFGDLRRPLLMLFAGAGFVLLIVCANVGNLVLARNHGRRREFALRTALGAGRGRLARQLIGESVLLTAAGGGLGLLAVTAAGGAVRAVQSEYVSSIADVGVDWTVVLFVAGLALVTSMLFGLLPLFQMVRSNLRQPLTEETAGAGVSRSARQLRSGLVVAEVMLAAVLVVGATLMTRSFVTLVTVPTGFEAAGLLTFEVAPPRWRYDTPERVRTFYQQLVPRLRAVPGVQNAALVSDLPFTTENRFAWVNPADDPRPEGEEPLIEYRTVGPGYFHAMGVDLLTGRDFRGGDRHDSGRVVLVNQTFAQTFWPGGGVIGRRFTVDRGESRHEVTVIGVVGDILDDGYDGQREPRFYYTFVQRPSRGMVAVLRHAGSLGPLIPAVRRAVHELDSEVLVSDFRPMDQVVAATVSDERAALLLTTVFSALALAVAGVGIYGVMSYAVGERRREIGIRSALGADRAAVMRLVLGHSGALTLVGTLGGLIAMVPLLRILEGFLYEVRGTDPIALVAAPLVLATVAFVASYIPASRATRISPVEALRSER